MSLNNSVHESKIQATDLRSDNIGWNIRTFRDKVANMTQVEFAQQIHIGRTTLANYELGKRTVPIDILLKIADYFDISLDILCYRRNFLERSNKK